MSRVAPRWRVWQAGNGDLYAVTQRSEGDYSTASTVHGATLAELHAAILAADKRLDAHAARPRQALRSAA